MRKRTNPYGVNQYTPPDPRQSLMWEYYTDPKSETFSNAMRSAIKAGYAKQSSKSITDEPWFREKARRLTMISKAERNLDEVLDLSIHKGVGKKKKIDGDALRERNKVTMFVAERLGKKHWSSRVELTGEGGERLMPDEQKKIDELFTKNIKNKK